MGAVPMSAAYDDVGAVGSEMSAIDDGGSMVCPVHGVHTRISCVSCARPICPDCAVTSPVGLTCGQHPQRSIRFVRWRPARGPARPAAFPTGIFVLLFLVLAFGARFTVGFFVALDAAQPWLGITIFAVLVVAITSASLYWLLPRF